jgi:hypothetical protein
MVQAVQTDGAVYLTPLVAELSHRAGLGCLVGLLAGSPDLRSELLS